MSDYTRMHTLNDRHRKLGLAVEGAHFRGQYPWLWGKVRSWWERNMDGAERRSKSNR